MQRIVFTLVTLAFVSTAAWSGDIRTDGKLISTEPTDPPIEVASSAKVTNLNADRLDGFHVDDFAVAGSGVGMHYENLVGLPGNEIDQDCAVDTGCFSGDTAGFPVTIKAPGSYRLASNLTTGDENTTLISIEASSVTLDLRGFALIGPVTCTGDPVTSCSPAVGTGFGILIDLNLANVTVGNGSVQGMGFNGVHCQSSCRLRTLSVTESHNNGITVEDIGGKSATIDNSIASRNGFNGIDGRANIRNSHSGGNGGRGIALERGSAIANTVSNNGNAGIWAASGGVVTNNTVAHNENWGIAAADGTLVQGNHVAWSSKDGIVCVNCMALDNTIYSNGEFGIDFGDSTSDSAYGRNWILGNTSGAVTGSGYTDLGHNVCDGAACP